MDVARELRKELGGRPDFIIGNYSDGNLVASLLSSYLNVTMCTIAHALEKTKYPDADVHWCAVGLGKAACCLRDVVCGQSNVAPPPACSFCTWGEALFPSALVNETTSYSSIVVSTSARAPPKTRYSCCV